MHLACRLRVPFPFRPQTNWLLPLLLAIGVTLAMGTPAQAQCLPGDVCPDNISCCRCGDDDCTLLIGEDCNNCPSDCANGRCDGADTCAACGPRENCTDCPSVCGANGCETAKGETCGNCWQDCCPPVCGANGCETAKGETCGNCSQDCCPAVCGANGCETAKGETCGNCWQDCCPPVCGANGCETAKGETCGNCWQDCCPPVCGANGCEAAKGETCGNCWQDCCPPVCGANGCEAAKGETCGNCSQDCCPAVCANGTCEPGETKATCSNDCADFYVRDWTNNAGDHDDGAEPSNDGSGPFYNFHDRCDVWNRQPVDAAGSFPDDKPDNQDARTVSNCAVPPCHNFGFVRVHRKAGPGVSLPAATVSAQFFRAHFGLGINFVPVGSGPALVSFTAVSAPAVHTMSINSPGLEWDLPDTDSGYMCFAVEITEPIVNDLPQPPGLLGGFPGQGIIQDNNKAQRNLMAVGVPPPPPSPSPAPGDGGGRRMGFLAIVHNALTYPRTPVVRYQAAPEVVERLGRAEIEVVGGERAALKPKGELRLADMQPGENRWIGLTVDLPTAETKGPLPVTFTEVPQDGLATTFTIAFQPTPLPALIRETLKAHRAVFIRVYALFQLPAAKEQAYGGETRESELTPESYARLLRRWLPIVKTLLEQLGAGEKDIFRLRETVAVLASALKTADYTAVVATHATLLNRLDAFLTMLQLERGNPADIVQNVYWQMTLFSRVPGVRDRPYARQVILRSSAFVQLHRTLPAEPDYSEFVTSILPELRAAVVDVRQHDLDLGGQLAAIERSLGSPVPLQKAHRGLLLGLQSLLK